MPSLSTRASILQTLLTPFIALRSAGAYLRGFRARRRLQQRRRTASLAGLGTITVGALIAQASPRVRRAEARLLRRAGDRTSEAAHSASDTAHEAADRVSETATSTTHTVRDSSRDMAATVADAPTLARERAEAVMDEKVIHPAKQAAFKYGSIAFVALTVWVALIAWGVAELVTAG